MRKPYNSPKLNFYIGDARDSPSVTGAMRGVDYVFPLLPAVYLGCV